MARPHLPTLKVEVAFASDPSDTTPTWTDISAYVRHVDGLSITRGRPNESATFSAGQVSMVLNNNDRRFCPSHSTGPYYGSLKPRKLVQITATWSAVDYVMFTGYVTGWPQHYGKGNKLVTVPLEAVDGLAVLAETVLADDAVHDYAETYIGNLAAFYRQNDGTAWVDTVGGAAAFPLNEVSLGSSMCAGSESPSVVFAASTAWVAPGTWAGVSISFWITTEVVGTSASVWAQVFGVNSIGYGSRIGVDNSGRICGETTDYTPGSFSEVRSAIPINDGLPHFVVFENSSGTPVVYVDGVNRSTSVVSSGNAGDQWVCMVIGAPSGSYLATSTEFIGSLQDVALFSATIPTAPAEFYQAHLGYIDESTVNRVDRVLQVIGWDTFYQDLTATPYGMCHATYTPGTSVLSHLQMVAATEQGRLFVNKIGELTLHSRYWHQVDTRGNTSQATFSPDGADINYQMLGTRYDDLDVANSVTVSADGIGSATSTDATSVTAYGLQSRSVSTLLPTIDLCQDMAAGLVYWFKDPQTRTLPLVVMPGAQTAKWATVLGLEIGDRITVEITPAGTGSQLVLTLLIESLAWDITAENWVLTIQASPVPASFAVYGTDVYGTGRYGF